MGVKAFIESLVEHPDYRQQVVHTQYIPSQHALPGTLESPLNPRVEALLDLKGISSLYSHQAQAINAILCGKHVMISTPSASGKTLCYQVATLEAVLENPNSCSLYLFPTKALAQDQLHSLRELASPGILSERDIVTFDGDTPYEERSGIKKHARVILTNPDMLHLGVLPNHKSWSRLFRNLKYVVIDEAHVYRGVFGSHVANIVRRLRRICALYGSSPQFICASATIANPDEHASRLVGQPFVTVIASGSPQGEKYFSFWNPPFIDKTRNVRRSPNSEAAFLLSQLMLHGIRSLVFARTRKLTELIYIYAREQMPHYLACLISPYRAGYLPEERREIERKFSNGELQGLIATTALELGINIGDLEATVLTGYPGSIASAWQQAGRSGRSTASSLSLLIAQDNPLDQYIMRHPDFFFSKNFDNVLINPDNLYILSHHLICAAWENPLDSSDKKFFGEIDQYMSVLEHKGALRERRGKWYPSSTVTYPAQGVNIRATRESYSVMDASRSCLLETVEASVAFSQVHPGAIYLHRGESYIITDLDLSRHIALARLSPADYYTQPIELTSIGVIHLDKRKPCGGIEVCYGEVEVTNQVVSFKKKRQLSEEVVGEEILDLPPQTFSTKAMWFDPPQKAVDRIREAGFDYHGGLHACEHATIGILPLFALCDRNDIGGVSTPFHPDTGRAQIFIYDAHPGGIGIAEKGFETIVDIWRTTLKLIRECTCKDGCPSCVQSPKCGNNNQPLDKKAAVIILEELVSEI